MVCLDRSSPMNFLTTETVLTIATPEMCQVSVDAELAWEAKARNIVASHLHDGRSSLSINADNHEAARQRSNVPALPFSYRFQGPKWPTGGIRGAGFPSQPEDCAQVDRAFSCTGAGRT